MAPTAGSAAAVAPEAALHMIEKIVQEPISSNKAVGMAGIMKVAALGGGNIDTLAPHGTPLRGQIEQLFGAM